MISGLGRGGQRFHLHGLEGSRANQMRQSSRIVAISLVGFERLERLMGLRLSMRAIEMARRFRQLTDDRRCSSTPSSWSRERPHSRGRERTHAKDEFLLTATAQNLRKLAKLIPLRRRIRHEAERFGCAR
jgi:hypothetical protein